MSTIKPLSTALAIAALCLSGCYVVPIAPDGSPVWPASQPTTAGRMGERAFPAMPIVLQARLYPANDIATQTGMVSGTVTNTLGGKGRFELNYRGELMTGEATRVSGDDRKGVASAYGSNGSFMSCEYQMSSPHQGAGACTFSNGAKYQAHIGN